MMDEGTSKVATFNLVQVTEVTSSNAMEKEGFQRCVKYLQDNNIKINRIATDRHTSIAKEMRKNQKKIKHQYDTWHMSKWVVKQLNKKAKKKECEELKPWIQSVSNHLWWSAATCNGDSELLTEKWTSVVHHVVNKHCWTGCKKFKKCEHDRLTRTQRKNTSWLTPGSPAHVALEEVVMNKRLLKDLCKLTDFCHTGDLEVFHSLFVKYCPKRQHFSYDGMVARARLAALDHNANANRDQATVRSGENAGELRYKLSFPKVHKRWVVKPIKEEKNYDHVSKMVKDVINACERKPTTDSITRVNLPRNIASKPRPDKAELFLQHRSRFSK